MARTPNPNRLPRNFHRTFIPERQYLHAMLRFAAAGKSGDFQEISAQTGIPTGASSGKAPAIYDYSCGMWLIRNASGQRSARKTPELTPFGRMVLLEDPFLKERMTQWLVHLFLCSPLRGADVWYNIFFGGSEALGNEFPRQKLEKHLSLIYQTRKAGIIGPLVRTYTEEAALRACGALSEESGSIHRTAAPSSNEYALPFGAWILQLIDDHFPGVGQVTVTELDSRAGVRSIPGWNIATFQRALDLISRRGVLEVDRHMDPWIIRPLMSTDEAWRKIFDDLV